MCCLRQTLQRRIGKNQGDINQEIASMTIIVKSNKTTKVVNAKIGSNMDTTRFKVQQTPTPATDGAQLVFTLPNSEEYVSGLLEVFLDGLMQTKTTDYAETTTSTFTFVNAPDADETLRVNYIKL